MAGAAPSVEMNVFVAAVDAGNFSAGARLLGITPSAVSKQISRLETRLGAQLFCPTSNFCRRLPRRHRLKSLARCLQSCLRGRQTRSLVLPQSQRNSPSLRAVCIMMRVRLLIAVHQSESDHDRQTSVIRYYSLNTESRVATTTLGLPYPYRTQIPQARRRLFGFLMRVFWIMEMSRYQARRVS